MRSPFPRVTYAEGFGRRTLRQRIEGFVYPWWLVVIVPLICGLAGWKLVELIP